MTWRGRSWANFYRMLILTFWDARYIRDEQKVKEYLISNWWSAIQSLKSGIHSRLQAKLCAFMKSVQEFYSVSFLGLVVLHVQLIFTASFHLAALIRYRQIGARSLTRAVVLSTLLFRVHQRNYMQWGKRKRPSFQRYGRLFSELLHAANWRLDAIYFFIFPEYISCKDFFKHSISCRDHFYPISAFKGLLQTLLILDFKNEFLWNALLLLMIAV